MGFTEEVFLFLFLPCSLIIYLLFSKCKKETVKNIIILGTSIVFYCWSGLNTLLVFLLITAVSYVLGELVFYISKLQHDNAENKKIGKIWIRISVIGMLIPLLWYKYFQFILDTINSISGSNIVLANLIVPLGISFVTFEAISYIVDIYKGVASPGSILDVLIFFAFFPKLISGPIILWRDFQVQLNNKGVSAEQISHGLERIIIGYAEKVIIADTFGAQILKIESQIATSGIDTQTAWLRAALFFFQLYYDFAGYSQIAIGLSEVFGFSFQENFHFPYLATSITEFWRRWHISLGRWFREYVYIPMGGNRRGNTYWHIFAVFLLTGIWHGANWTFLLWGIGHGLLIIWERYIREKKWYKETPKLLKWVFTMLCVFFLWILFGARNLIDAGNTYYSLFNSVDNTSLNFTWKYFLTTKILLLLVIAFAGSIAGLFKITGAFERWLNSSGGVFARRVTLIVLFVLDILFVVNSTYSPFIYFQF